MDSLIAKVPSLNTQVPTLPVPTDRYIDTYLGMCLCTYLGMCLCTYLGYFREYSVALELVHSHPKSRPKAFILAAKAFRVPHRGISVILASQAHQISSAPRDNARHGEVQQLC